MNFVDLKRQRDKIEPKLRSRLDRVLAHGKFILGPEVSELEQALCATTGVKHCIGVANGTDALQIALRALGIGPGDAVFVPAFTFVATAEAASQIGATPVFVDVRHDTFNICSESLEAAVEQVRRTPLTPSAVIAVDLFGLTADYAAIEAVAKKESLRIIEDGAQSLGASANGKMACSFGDIATTSFFPAKPLGCYGDGGAVFTDDDELAELMRSLRVHGKGSSKYDNERVGLNSRLDTIQAAVLLAKLSVFEEEIDRRDEIANFYSGELAASVTTPTIPPGHRSAWAQYTVKVPAALRNRLADELRGADIPTAVYYPKPLNEQSVYADSEIAAHCPVSRALCREVLSIPVHPYLTTADTHHIVDALKSSLASLSD